MNTSCWSFQRDEQGILYRASNHNEAEGVTCAMLLCDLTPDAILDYPIPAFFPGGNARIDNTHVL